MRFSAILTGKCTELEFTRGGAGRSFITEQLTRNEQVSGSSPLVGSLYFLFFRANVNDIRDQLKSPIKCVATIT